MVKSKIIIMRIIIIIIIIIIIDDQIILAIKLSFITFDLRCRTYNWPSP
jgi:hypothetical protein